MQDGKNLAKLASGFPLFQFDNEPQACAGSHGQILLGHAHAFTSASDQLAYLFRSVFHRLYLMLPSGNITPETG